MGRYSRFTRSILCLFFIAAAGCTHLPVTGLLPDTSRISELARVDADSPFALDADGETVAFVNRGLTLQGLNTGNRRLVSADRPTALAWSPDGKLLAAAFYLENIAVLRLYDQQGEVRAQARLAGRANALAWRSSSSILVHAVQQRVYSFGANLAGVLYSWDGKSEPVPTPLYETTLMPAFYRQWEGTLQRTLTFSISPLNNEILYTRLYSPPAFTPYLKLMLRHLEGGTEREIAIASLNSAGGIFLRSGEQIIYGDGEKESQLFDPWGDRTVSTLPSPGRSLALSPSGSYLLLDGHLYRDGKEIASFPSGSVGVFSHRGGRLAIRYGERLYLIANLPEKPAVPLDPVMADRLRQLHKWLSEGLISAQDYRKAREDTAR